MTKPIFATQKVRQNRLEAILPLPPPRHERTNSLVSYTAKQALRRTCLKNLRAQFRPIVFASLHKALHDQQYAPVRFS